MLQHKENSSTQTLQNPLVQKKKKKMQHVEQNNFPPLLIKWAKGGEWRSLGQIQVKKSNMIIP